MAGPSLVKVFPSPFVNSWTMLPATPHPPAAGRVDLRGHRKFLKQDLSPCSVMIPAPDGEGEVCPL